MDTSPPRRSGCVPDIDHDTQLAALTARLDATRSLLNTRTAAEVSAVMLELVRQLGGAVIPAREADASAVPLDLTFGEDQPLLATAPTGSIARRLLEQHLPQFAEDARRAVTMAREEDQLTREAALDGLTGLLNRRMVNRVIGTLLPGDVITIIDLDHFKAVNDGLGHQAGDEVLRAFGSLLHDETRQVDRCGRYGGEEFVVLLPAGALGIERFLSRLQAQWLLRRPHPVTFSAGIATAGTDPLAALRAADEALYVAKRNGRDRWVWAGSSDDEQP